MANESENAIAARVRDVFERTDPELAQFLLDGGTPDPGDVIDDARAMVSMLGAALSGDNKYFGGEPATHVVCSWIFAIERRLEVAQALSNHATISDRSGGTGGSTHR